MISGTILNVIAVLFGSALGNLLGGRLPERLRQTVVLGMGVFTMLLGIQMFLETKNTLITLGSIFLGAILGEWWQIEDGLQKLGEWLQHKFMPNDQTENDQGKFIEGFLTASLVFCIGPVAILGSLQEGLTGKIDLLLVKSTLDGLVSLAFASSLGLGVAFSAFPILVYQGALTLLARQLQTLMTDAMIQEMTASGGVLLVAMSISNFLELRKIRVGNLLPALVIAPAIVAFLAWSGIVK